jgi:hypothetical protein
MHAVKLAGQADPTPDVPVRAPASPVAKFAGDCPTSFRLHSSSLMVRAAAVHRLPWVSATSGQRAGLCGRAARTSRLGLEWLRIGGCGGARIPETVRWIWAAMRLRARRPIRQNAARLEQLRGPLRERFGFAAHWVKRDWVKRDLAGYALDRSKPENIRFTNAVRGDSGNTVNMCANCWAGTGR